MASVTYKSVSGKGYIFPVTVNEVESWVEINPIYTTRDAGIQSAIEAKPRFKTGDIEKSVAYDNGEDEPVDVKEDVIPLDKTEGHGDVVPPEGVSISVVESVVNFTQAKEVLRADPYNVHHMKLKTPEAVMEQAKAHSVEFPNWII